MKYYVDKNIFDIPFLSILSVNLTGVVDFVVFALTFRLSDTPSHGNIIKHSPCIRDEHEHSQRAKMKSGRIFTGNKR